MLSGLGNAESTRVRLGGILAIGVPEMLGRFSEALITNWQSAKNGCRKRDATLMTCADDVAVLYAGVACPVLSQSDAGGRRFRSGPLMIGTISVDLQLDPRENVRSLRRVPFGARMRGADLVVSRFCTQESEGYPSGQRGQTVNLLAYAFGGSNPPPSTSLHCNGASLRQRTPLSRE